VIEKGEKTRNPNIAVTRVKERPGFPIRNKFESPKREMIKTGAVSNFPDSNIRYCFELRASDFEFSALGVSAYLLPGLMLGAGVGVGAGKANGSRATVTWKSARPNANKLPSGEYATPVTYE
jgi:hypothetical protein